MSGDGRRRRLAARLACGGLLATLALATHAAEPPADAAVDARAGVADGTQAPEFLGGVLTESRVLYPLQVGSWVAESEHRYPEQRLGVSVRFAHPRQRRWIDPYFYPGGEQSPRALAASAGGEREGIASAARQAGREATLGDLESFNLPRGAGGDGAAAQPGIPAWRLGLAYPDEDMASAMLVFAQDLYVVKARASAAQPPATVGTLQQELQVFMESVAAQLRIVSTGACWLPARTDIAATLPAADGDGVLASYRDPGRDVAAVVIGDRVLVARAEASRAPELATQLAGALYPGCVAPEATEPEVPPPLREIRIEYRTSDPGDGPVRGPRIGRPRAPLTGTG